MKFYRNFFTLVSALFLGVSKLTFKFTLFHLNITLQMNMFIDRYSPSNTLSHCGRICLSLVMNTLCAGDEHFWRWRKTLLALKMNTFGAGVERIWHWRIMCFALEINTLVLEMNEFNTRVKSSATHTHQLATRDFQIEFMSWWLLITATHLRKRVLWHCREPKGV